MSEELDLALGLLDHQIVDCDGRRCGNVDDLSIEGGGETPRVAAILAGPGAWRSRGPLGRLAGRIGGGRRVRVPWEEVAAVGSHVRLKRRATEYGLGLGDDRARRWVARLPGAER
jgi:sporulation protein YlmC with PRC-barrel domain